MRNKKKGTKKVADGGGGGGGGGGRVGRVGGAAAVAQWSVAQWRCRASWPYSSASLRRTPAAMPLACRSIECRPERIRGGARGRPQHEAAEQLRPLRPHLGRRRLQQ